MQYPGWVYCTTILSVPEKPCPDNFIRYNPAGNLVRSMRTTSEIVVSFWDRTTFPSEVIILISNPYTGFGRRISTFPAAGFGCIRNFCWFAISSKPTVTNTGYPAEGSPSPHVLYPLTVRMPEVAPGPKLISTLPTWLWYQAQR